MIAPAALLVVRHSSGRVGLDIAQVREIVLMLAPRPIPAPPPGVLGMMSLRGEIIAIVDLESRLPAGAGPLGMDSHVVVLDFDGRTVALAVSSVDALEEVVSGTFRGAEGLLPPGSPVIGVAQVGKDVIPILDPRSLLTAVEAISLQDVLRRFAVSEPQ